MEKEIKTIAVVCAVFVLFVLATVSWCYGCGPGVCTSRALVGAIAMYLIVSLAGRLTVRILIGAMVDHRMEKQKAQDRKD